MGIATKAFFYIVQASILVWTVLVLTASFAKADTVKTFAQKSNLENLLKVDQTWIHCTYPAFGINKYFVKSLAEIRQEEALALEAEILKTSMEKFDDELIELPLEQPHFLGLNGYLHHSASNQKEFNLIHINFK